MINCFMFIQYNKWLVSEFSKNFESEFRIWTIKESEEYEFNSIANIYILIYRSHETPYIVVYDLWSFVYNWIGNIWI